MNNKIFVSIASWRDPFVINTIKSLIDNAYAPENLVFGVVFQGYPKDNWMLDGIYSLGAEVRLEKIDANIASPYLGAIRGKIMMSLMQDEKYFFQIDSHIKADKNWDISLIAELELATEHFGKVVLQTYSVPFSSWDQPFRIQGLSQRPSKTSSWIDSVIQFVDQSDVVIDPNNIDNSLLPLAIRGEYVTRNMDIQALEMFYDAKGIFSYAEYPNAVPIPDNLAMWVEQPTLMARLFTAGYSLVSTTRCYTNNFDYDGADLQPGYEIDKNVRHIRNNDPLWKNILKTINVAGYKVYMNTIMNNLIDHEAGLFSERSLEEYIDFIGYNPVTFEVKNTEILEHHKNYVDSNTLNNRINKVVERIFDEAN